MLKLLPFVETLVCRFHVESELEKEGK